MVAQEELQTQEIEAKIRENLMQKKTIILGNNETPKAHWRRSVFQDARVNIKSVR